MAKIEKTETGQDKITENTAFIPDNAERNVKLPIPAHLGKGYMMIVELGKSMNLMIHNYQLLVALEGQKKSDPLKKDIIVFSFRNVFKGDDVEKNNFNTPPKSKGETTAVQVSTCDMNVSFSYPPNTIINSLVISVHKEFLLDLIYTFNEKSLLQKIILNDKPFLYEEFVSPAIRAIASKISLTDINSELSVFSLRIRCEELIYYFLLEFLKRKSLDYYPLNPADVKLVYQVRDNLLSDLSITPNLSEIAKFSGISESKLNRIFKQIFGSPIYNYHQKIRISEASKLLEGHMTVSEVGYKLGFSNLSHFTKLFKRYIGENPKTFQKAKRQTNVQTEE